MGGKKQENQSVIQSNRKLGGIRSATAEKIQRRGNCQPQQAFNEEKQKTNHAQFSQALQPRGVPWMGGNWGGQIFLKQIGHSLKE